MFLSSCVSATACHLSSYIPASYTRAPDKDVHVPSVGRPKYPSERVFTPLDDQSVPEAVACLRALLALPGAAAQIDLGADEKMRVADLTIWAAEGMLLIAHDLASELSTILRTHLDVLFATPRDFLRPARGSAALLISI